jgi:hypothetical protein
MPSDGTAVVQRFIICGLAGTRLLLVRMQIQVVVLPSFIFWHSSFPAFVIQHSAFGIQDLKFEI